MKTNILNFKLPLEQAELLGTEIYNAAFVVKNIGSCIPFLTLWALKTSRTFWTLWTCWILWTSYVCKSKEYWLDGTHAVAELSDIYETPFFQWFCSMAVLTQWALRSKYFWSCFQPFFKTSLLSCLYGVPKSFVYPHRTAISGRLGKKATALSNFANLIWYRFFGELCTCSVKV